MSAPNPAVLREIAQRKEKESDKVEDKEEDDDGYPHVNSTLMIFADVERKSRLKSLTEK